MKIDKDSLCQPNKKRGDFWFVDVEQERNIVLEVDEFAHMNYDPRYTIIIILVLSDNCVFCGGVLFFFLASRMLLGGTLFALWKPILKCLAFL